MERIDEEISHYQKALDAIDQSSGSDLSAAALRALIARDRVALALAGADADANPSAIQLLASSDRRLNDLAVKLDSGVGGETLKSWRKSRSPDKNSWWWALDEVAIARQPRLNRLWTFFAVLFLMASFGLVADTFNLLRTVGENPISTVGNLAQAVLTFIAASAFTPSGRKWLVDSFSHLGIKGRKFQGVSRMFLALAVLLLTLAIRSYLPALAAAYFQREGDRYFAEELLQRAIPAYQEASVLQPYSVPGHLSLAKATEKAGDYGRAIEEYNSAIVLYDRQSQPAPDDSYYLAKIRLARLLILHEQNYPAVLRILDKPEDMVVRVSSQNRRLYSYLLWTYLGWANLKLGNYDQARGELNAALQLYEGGAEAHYLSGLVFEAQKDQDPKNEERARQEWARFSKILQTDRKQLEEVPPDWISYAQEKTLAKGVQ